MQIIADLHTHTLFSSHAFNTVTEMINQAINLNLKALAITDHGPNMPDSGYVWHFFNKGQIPKQIGDLLVLYGAEADVLNVKGDLDIPENLLENLDWVIASIHKEIIPKLSPKEATSLWLNVAENPYVDQIGHCEQVEHFFDYDTVIKKFAQCNKIVEINANSALVRPLGKENMILLAQTCAKHGCKIAVNSDAHSIYTIGRVKHTLEMLEHIQFPKELIVNADYQLFLQELKIHNKPIVKILEK